MLSFFHKKKQKKVFSCKLQGKRAKKTKEMIKELVKDDSEL